MAFHISRRKLKPKEEEEVGELNIVPYLDIVMNLVMFMLLSMTGLATFGILNVNAPNYGGTSASAPQLDDGKPKLLLSVLISKKGFYIAGAGAVLGEGAEAAPADPAAAAPTVPALTDGSHDFASLNQKMVQIKSQFPSETKVIVGAEGEIAYETLIQTMDAIRETPGEHKLLFSDVTLAAM